MRNRTYLSAIIALIGAAYLLVLPLARDVQGNQAVCYEDPFSGDRYLYTYCPQDYLEGKSDSTKVQILENWKAIPTRSQRSFTEYYQCQNDIAQHQHQLQQAQDEQRGKQEEYEKARAALQKNLLKVTARLGLSTAIVLTDQVTNAVRVVRAIKDSFQQATADIRAARQRAEREVRYNPYRQREIAAARGFTKAAPNPENPKWPVANLDDATLDALIKFRAGKVGKSLTGIDIRGKSFTQIDAELSGGSWRPHPTDPTKQISADGKWTKTVQNNTAKEAKLPDGSATPWRQVFYENADGGVVRLKPDGWPDAKPEFEHMTRPHGIKYVKKDPTGDTSYNNEAFKVDGRTPIPKLPDQIELPNTIRPGTDEVEEFIQLHWVTPAHVPLTSGGGS